MKNLKKVIAIALIALSLYAIALPAFAVSVTGSTRIGHVSTSGKKNINADVTLKGTGAVTCQVQADSVGNANVWQNVGGDKMWNASSSGSKMNVGGKWTSTSLNPDRACIKVDTHGATIDITYYWYIS